MSNIRVNTTELLQLLEMTPSSHNIMLVGRHGIGKSEILTEYFRGKGMPVVALFLGQMADPGDLIGIPAKNEQTGKTEFMPPYWFPLDGKPIVLFLDELNRARPEILPARSQAGGSPRAAASYRPSTRANSTSSPIWTRPS